MRRGTPDVASKPALLILARAILAFAVPPANDSSDANIFVTNVSFGAVPEPSSLLLIAAGVGLVLRRRRHP